MAGYGVAEWLQARILAVWVEICMVRWCYSADRFQLSFRVEYGAKFFPLATTRHFSVGTSAH